MTHTELIEAGYEYAKAEDHDGVTRTGYWAPGDGNGKGYGDFIGKTEEDATEAIEG